MARWVQRAARALGLRGAATGPPAPPPGGSTEPPPPPERDAERRLRAAEQLQLLGLSAEGAARALRACPAALRLPAPQLEARAGLLRRLGLERDALRRCPQLLALPRGRLEAAERLLRQRCLFTAAQLGALLRACPALLLREPHALHQHFQYAYFRMGLRHEAMARGRLFCAPFVELRRRHGFLERLGLYRAPRKGLERPRNPRLEELLHVPEATFVRRVARSTAHEYNVFKRLLAREEQEQQAEEDEDDDEDDDDNEDDDVLLLAWKGEALDSDGGGS